MTDSSSPDPASIPRRGRKPSSTSRTARESQRKLNHSIIEKARRTKINDALATLKLLVPPSNHSNQLDVRPSDEKDRPFKLDILERTVSFVQQLVDRVAVLEEQLAAAPSHCLTCQNNVVPPKRNRDDPSSAVAADIDEEGKDAGPSKKARTTQRIVVPPTPSPYSCARLPSISSWLSDLPLDPRPRPSSPLLPPFQHSSLSYLPSPPSSGRCGPMLAAYTPPPPPALTLGPTATPSSYPYDCPLIAGLAPAPAPAPIHHHIGLTQPQSRSVTTEDVSAASSLLQISAAHSRPSSSSSSSHGIASAGVTPAIISSCSCSDCLRSRGRRREEDSVPTLPCLSQVNAQMLAHTPGSVLGLSLRTRIRN